MSAPALPESPPGGGVDTAAVVGGLLHVQRANPLERRDTLCRKLGRARLVLERVTRWRQT